MKRDSVKVALLLPLSGKPEAIKVATALKQSGEMALFEFNRPNVVLMTKDTKGTPEGARAAAQAAIASGAELIVGPLFAQSVEAAAQVARPANVPVLSFSSDARVAGNGVFLLSFVPGEDVNRIVAYAASRGKRNFAALIPKTPYGQIVERALRQAVPQAGVTLSAVEAYPPNANGMLEPARAIKNAVVAAEQSGNPIDTIMIPAGPDTLPTLAAMMPYFDIDTKKVQLIGTGDWEYPNVGQEKPLVGGWFAATDPRGWRQFKQRYTKTYGAAPPRTASLAYDAVSLAISLSNNPQGQRFTTANLTRRSGFAGTDGLFRLNAQGLAERGYAVLEVQKFGPQILDPAPSVFSSNRFSYAAPGQPTVPGQTQTQTPTVPRFQ